MKDAKGNDTKVTRNDITKRAAEIKKASPGMIEDEAWDIAMWQLLGIN